MVEGMRCVRPSGVEGCTGAVCAAVGGRVLQAVSPTQQGPLF